MTDALQLRGPGGIAERLRSARTAAQLEPHEVARRFAKRMGVTTARVKAFEAGTASPGMDVLAGLATIYQRDLNWFLEHSPALINVRYRNLKSRVSVKDLKSFEDQATRLSRAYLAIEEHLDCPLRGAELPKQDPEMDPVAVASEIRTRLRLRETDAVPSMMDVLEHFGIRVLEAPTDLAIDGLAARLGTGYAVVLNSGVPRDRARLNAGHELAHIITGDCDRANPSDAVEARASTFASHLLLTSAMLREAFREKSVVTLVRYKERFGISLAAMVYRATAEGILTATMSRKLWIEFSRRGWRRHEPGQVRDDRAIRFETLLDRALLEREESLGDLARVTGLTEQEISGRLELAVGRSRDAEGHRDHREVGRHFQLRIAQ